MVILPTTIMFKAVLVNHHVASWISLFAWYLYVIELILFKVLYSKMFTLSNVLSLIDNQLLYFFYSFIFQM